MLGLLAIRRKTGNAAFNCRKTVTETATDEESELLIGAILPTSMGDVIVLKTKAQAFPLRCVTTGRSWAMTCNSAARASWDG
jgi:hypothetical protein